MPRVCTVCKHPNRIEIDKALVNSDAYRRVAAHFSIGESALRRHKSEHLPEALAKTRAAQEIAERLVNGKAEQEAVNAADVMNELLAASKRVALLYDACDRWLRDPEHPEQYDIGARAEDIDVTFFENGANGKPIKKKTKLSDLLQRAKLAIGNGLEYGMIETKHADPRELILKTFDRLKAHLELLAELQGKLNRNPQLNVIVSPEWVLIRTTILKVLEPYPDARQVVAKALTDGSLSA